MGIDWGVRTIATTTNPDFDLAHPQHGRNGAAALAKYQRRMARRAPARGQRGSRGYKKARRDAARAHKKVARQRQDTARKWARKVTRAHGRIAVEDFKPAFLSKSRMARKAADATISVTRNELVSYATRVGRQVVMVPPAYTTMTCSLCGSRAKTRLSLSERTFRCEACGFIADRDRNAASNMLVRAGFHPADADAVRRPALRKRKRTLAESGIPRL